LVFGPKIFPPEKGGFGEPTVFLKPKGSLPRGIKLLPGIRERTSPELWKGVKSGRIPGTLVGSKPLVNNGKNVWSKIGRPYSTQGDFPGLTWDFNKRC